MSKVEPRYAEEVPYVPMNFTDRNNLVGQVMPIIEASIPDKKQQEAVKNLIKRVISDYFHSEFSLQFSQVTQDNVVGEIIVKCDGLMHGYLDDPQTTSAVIKDGWLWTGDLGYRDKEGFIYLKGRKKDIAIIGGKNVSLSEVDEVLYSHPEITNAVSFSVPEEVSGEKIVSFVTVTDSFNKVSQEDIINYCHKNSSSYKSPKEIYFVNSFPLGGAGKILRAKVKEWYLDGKTKW